LHRAAAVLRRAHRHHLLSSSSVLCLFFFFHDTATTTFYTLSLHDALPIYHLCDLIKINVCVLKTGYSPKMGRLLSVAMSLRGRLDRKSTRLNSSHVKISYAVFCLKKKKK